MTQGTVVVKGVVHGKTIELERILGCLKDKRVTVTMRLAQAQPICPDAVHDAAEQGPAAPGSLDARTLRNLPKAERERLLEQAATLVQSDYEAGGTLAGFEALGEEDQLSAAVALCVGA